MPTDIDSMTFHEKVHALLQEDKIKDAIYWLPHGRAFLCNYPRMLEKSGVLAKYFGHSRYSSFLRQLSNHKYKQLSQGKDRSAHYHEFMLRGMPHLSKYMPEPKEARHLTPDPEHELDFYAISRTYPLPDDPNFASKYATAVAVPMVAAPMPPAPALYKAAVPQQQQSMVPNGLASTLASSLQSMAPPQQRQNNAPTLLQQIVTRPVMQQPAPLLPDAATVEALLQALTK